MRANVLPLYVKAAAPRRRGDTLPSGVHTLVGQQIDVDHLARYQQVCGFRVSHLLPPTYLHVLAFPLSLALMTERGFPFSLVGLVHVENSIKVARPVHAEEIVNMQVRAADLRAHRVGRQFDVLAEARVGADLVWSGRSTYLHREKPPADRPAREVPAPAAGVAAQVRVPADIGRRYAAVSGDRNPIHLSKVAARLFGFPRAIAHGMWLAARTLAAMEGRLPEAFAVDVAFKRPVLLPSTVTIDCASEAAGWALDVRSARSGKPHLAGTLTRLSP